MGKYFDELKWRLRLEEVPHDIDKRMDVINAALGLGPDAKVEDSTEAHVLVTALLSVAAAVLAQNFRREAPQMAKGYAQGFRETVDGMVVVLTEGN